MKSNQNIVLVLVSAMYGENLKKISTEEGYQIHYTGTSYCK